MTYAFPGTEKEAYDLTVAIMHNCTHPTVDGVMQPGPCPAHTLLEPNYVNHLLTARNTIKRLAEFSEVERKAL